MNKLKILFNKARDKVELEFTTDKKIDKKDLTEKCEQLANIDTQLRDYLLRKYLIRCKLYHSLAFFRWRDSYAECTSEE